MSPKTPTIRIISPEIEVLEITTRDGDVFLTERTEETTVSALVAEFGAPLSIKYRRMTPLALAITQFTRYIERTLA